MSPAPVSASQTGHINMVAVATQYYEIMDYGGERYRVIGDKNPDANGVYWGRLMQQENQGYLKSGGVDVRVPYKQTVGGGTEYLAGAGTDVSWRTDFGVEFQFPKSNAEWISALQDAAPSVNTIRLDINKETLENPSVLAKWRTFANDLATNGYQLLLDYTDGDMSGQALGIEASESGFTIAQHMNQVGEGWADIMTWLEQPAQANILNAVYGFELVNEPMLYSNNATHGALYAQHIKSILEDHGTDWHGKNILVGGLRASAQFQHIDKATIKTAVAGVGSDLVWSMHLYPGWVGESLDFDREDFHAAIQGRIGSILGDNILVTEMNLNSGDTDGDGIESLFDLDDMGHSTYYAAARSYEWFAENGIGVSYWAPSGRPAAWLTNEGANGIGVRQEMVALMNNIWSQDETESAAGIKTVDANGKKTFNSVKVEDGLANTYWTAYGEDTNDNVIGTTSQDLLYGGAGHDDMTGRSGDDWIFGQDGDDKIEGNTGRDRLDGGRGNDWIQGGQGDDFIDGGEGINFLDGAADNDTIIAGGGDIVRTGNGNDTLYILRDPSAPVYLVDFNVGDTLVFGIPTSEHEGLPPIAVTAQRDAQNNYIFKNTANEQILLVMAKAGAQNFVPEALVGVTTFSDLTSGPALSGNYMSGHTPNDFFKDVFRGGSGLPGVPVETSEGLSPLDAEDEEDLVTPPQDGDDTQSPGAGDPQDEDDMGAPPATEPTPGENEEGDDDDKEEKDEKSGSCFVATAAYGSADHPDVVALRLIRDEIMVKSAVGRAFVRAYWRLGPVMARNAAEYGAIKALVRHFVKKIVASRVNVG